MDDLLRSPVKWTVHPKSIKLTDSFVKDEITKILVDGSSQAGENIKSNKWMDPSVKARITKIFVNGWNPFYRWIQLQIGLS